METLVTLGVPDNSFWRGKRVLVTGHTGFKGAWLSHWLLQLGAQVHGLALAPDDRPNVFDLTGLQDRLASHTICDIRDADAVRRAVSEIAPQITFHMAAQAIVRRSFADPIESFATNVLGTAHVLDALRQTVGQSAIVNVTSDKCYENAGLGQPFTEDDPMGGSDPYSASKGCAELVAASYQRTFFAGTSQAMASARAGNVIGGGDWADDRLVPDVVRAMASGSSVDIRNPEATRPWQHVLEPLSGYLLLAEALWTSGDAFSGGWNFGPLVENAVPVKTLLTEIGALAGWRNWHLSTDDHPKEAQLLHLDISKAEHRLGWRPALSLSQTLDMTMSWYAAAQDGADMAAVTNAQIAAYTEQRSAL